ncbi:sugar phosphate isomerase/epimerase family protein [Peribacillus sp. SCS-155]|uniref:sugar phosphate isomerase/epimerase family protein n=1 Tax=Peribacillus sedimenti TaxID=3115297 RepID=UPI0039059960
MKKLPIALQMYTLREQASKDFAGTLNEVARLGYDGVEFAGFGGLSASEVRKVLDDVGLRAASSHIPIPVLESDLEQVIEEQLLVGSKYIVCPYVPEEDRNEKYYIRLISLLNKAGERCSRTGITLCYHNHDFELDRMSDGRTALQMILEETNPDWVKAEFDVYWLTYANENPTEWLQKYGSRTPIVHLKDMTTDGERFFAELGTGGVDIESVLQQGVGSNIEWWIIEQDECRKNPIQSVAESLQYLKGK